jgi:16S rRNA (adenine1518-N6/adenine1519-N6)-dimethyltransferase
VLKRFGQHFLKDEKILASIADALGPTQNDVVVEIGPGRGSLTEILAQRSRRLIAIELDRALAEMLGKKYADNRSVEIIQDDVLKVNLGNIAGPNYLLIGNVPYYITTPIIFHALQEPFPKRIVFLVQKEVAERMVAKPGTREYGALSVNLQIAADVEIVRSVPAGAFDPPPKVDSAVVRITPKPQPDVDLEKFRSFVQALFGQRRKQLQKSLRSVATLSPNESERILRECDVDPTARPETISSYQLLDLFRRTMAKASFRL